MRGPKEIAVTSSSGNVFADLELPEPEELLAKAELVRQISIAIDERGLTQSEAGELMGIDQAKVSALLAGQLNDVALDQLLRFLIALDRDVQIVVRPKQSERAHVTVA